MFHTSLNPNRRNGIMDSEEIWKPYPEFPWVQGSNLGRVRTMDRWITYNSGRRQFVKGHVLPQYRKDGGYLGVGLHANGRKINRKVHRIIASCFIENPDNLPQVNHKNCIRDDNCVENLEWCTASYNIHYREKHGKALGHSLWAVNVNTQEKLRFPSQHEAGRELRINNQSISMVIKGELNQAGGYFFAEDESEITNEKIRKIKTGMPYKGGVIAVNLETQVVLCFKSQSEATRQLKLSCGDVAHVIKGKQKTAHGFWFTKTDENAMEATRLRFGDATALKVAELMAQ